MFLGDTDRAIRAVISGIEINPLYPASYLEDLAEVYFAARRYQDMFDVLDRIPAKTPILTGWAAAGYAHSGEIAKARNAVEQLVAALDPVWVGPRSPVPNYHGWVMSLSPFAKAEDRDHLSTGLEQAGLPVLDCR
jgi:hypothetical protein